MGLLPFFICEQSLIQGNFRHNCICVDTFRTYLSKLTSVVGYNINQTLSDHFTAVFNGSSDGDSHSVSEFPPFPKKRPLG